MSADAGARDRHARSESGTGKGEDRPDGTDMGVGRQPHPTRIGQPCPQHDSIADRAGGERREDAEGPARVSPVDQIAPQAEEAEARALEHEAEQGSECQREREPAAAGIAGEIQGGGQDTHADQGRRRDPQRHGGTPGRRTGRWRFGYR